MYSADQTAAVTTCIISYKPLGIQYRTLRQLHVRSLFPFGVYTHLILFTCNIIMTYGHFCMYLHYTNINYYHYTIPEISVEFLHRVIEHLIAVGEQNPSLAFFDLHMITLIHLISLIIHIIYFYSSLSG